MSGITGAGAVSNSGVVGKFPAGHIVQISENFSDNTNSTISSTHSFQTISVITGTITPLYDDSSIMINCMFSAYLNNFSAASNVSNPGLAFRWLKQSASLVTEHPAGTTIGHNNSANPQFYLAIDDGGNLEAYNMAMAFSHVLMDEDCETTSTITYTLQCAPYNAQSGSKVGALNASSWWQLYFMEIKR